MAICLKLKEGYIHISTYLTASRRRALDASFSEFGEYEQQFYSALQVGWYNEVAFYKPLDSGTQVSISFILKSDGSIDSVTVLSSSAGLIATTICESAIGLLMQTTLQYTNYILVMKVHSSELSHRNLCLRCYPAICVFDSFSLRFS